MAFYLTSMAANPYYYDYRHELAFKPDGSVAMCAGAGQAFNTKAKARYRIEQKTESSATIAFYEVQEMAFEDLFKDTEHPCYEDVEPFTTTVIREEGCFPFRCDIVWNLEYPERDWPCLLYTARYIFDTDPLKFGIIGSEVTGNLYYQFEQKDFNDSERYYYPVDTRQELTVQQMLDAGIPKNSFW